MRAARRSWRTTTGWVLAVLVALGAGAWAGRATLAPPTVETASVEALTYTVAEETVGHSVSVPVTVTWPTADLAAGASTGTVTTVDVEPGATVAAGDRLLTVGLRPVVVLAGSVPAFRDLGADTEGQDVAQLQAYLREAGYLTARRGDGVFGPATERAVRAWQKDAGFPVDGVVRTGDVYFVTDLPARIVLDPGVVVGAVLAPGERLVSTITGDPVFEMVLSVEQASLVPTSGPARVRSGESTWDATISSATSTSDGSLRLLLTAPDGGPVCGSDCAALDVVRAVEGGTAGGGPAPSADVVASVVLDGEIVVVEEATGPTVPAAALRTRADGSVQVVVEDGTADGREAAVTIVSSGSGRSVVEGVEVGDVVRLFEAGTG
ncbi:peptidoglycan-binding protein [Cellulosimicrobium sp. ES-005]|uniref:Peptidoglycan-binding protein n=1 Tax=Cellulosimicrobium sp. ES-005 TaxID=3163031 RepID=A0AAU8G148_9MICO